MRGTLPLVVVLLLFLLSCAKTREQENSAWKNRSRSLVGKQVHSLDPADQGARFVVADRPDSLGQHWIQLDGREGPWVPATNWQVHEGRRGSIATH